MAHGLEHLTVFAKVTLEGEDADSLAARAVGRLVHALTIRGAEDGRRPRDGIDSRAGRQARLKWWCGTVRNVVPV
ncbi:MAG: hypothetical protein AMXMBFR80_19070 [Dehalococcoidia bacterium]